MLKKTFENKMKAARAPKMVQPVKKAGVIDTVKKVVKAPVNFLKKQFDKNQAFKNKNSTYEKFKQNSK